MTGSSEYLNVFKETLINMTDMRFLPIIMHQFIEEHIDRIIKYKFINSNKILENDYAFGFKQKCIILEAFGIFDDDNGRKLKMNIKIISEIRNYYAHEMDNTLGKMIPASISDKINAMYDFFGGSSLKVDLVLMFKTKCLSTIAELNRVAELINEPRQ